MIYTCTLNPSVDYIVKLDELKQGEVNLAAQDSKIPGGKGVNVSKVLKRLGIESRILGFVGGFTGSFIENVLQEEQLGTDFIKVDGDTRINIKLKSQEETEINGLSPDINENHLNLLFDKLSVIEEGDLLVLSGSVPGCIRNSIYKELIESISSKARVIVDSKGEPLKKALQANPFLVKPNHHELGDLFDVRVDSIEKAKVYGQKLIEMGAQNAIVSMAGEGAILFTGEKAFRSTVPKGEVKNSVGAGDSVVAGFLSAIVKGEEIVDAFRFGVASGSATAFSEGFCTIEQVNRLIPQVLVKELT
ncbi:1-phosphofructokinase [Pseudalkalibacillus caeni]|uniref:Tagatose-6-phosphate kinase n=1 Tax=Exobacillus caeni TaxID=2574798 RepID=A0A5R9FHL5_9BACL|nr:1-phosphofructokinase [Pseudalkalibacillus caeni]TLS39065.1 1-phosphofructokinase [Pseudalkalibacillus caeni]